MMQSPGKEQLWLSTPAQGANWTARDADLLVMSPCGKLAVVGASRSSDAPQPVYAAIGVAGVVVNDAPNDNAWALYADVQHEDGAKTSFGMEIAAKNKGASKTIDPYSATAEGVFGIWLAGGGDESYGGAGDHGPNTAILIGKNGKPWNKGVVFMHGGLAGAFPIAVHMPTQYRIVWEAPNGRGGEVRSDVGDTANRVALVLDDNRIYYVGANDKGIVSYAHVANAVNSLAFFNAVTGSGPVVSASGDDVDIDIRLAPKGAGHVRFGTHTASADAVSNGYITIKDAAGNTVKLMTRA
jgi:hypothetical protein